LFSEEIEFVTSSDVGFSEGRNRNKNNTGDDEKKN
jgi:hypothetical protein